jgi:hypothetical protein
MCSTALAERSKYDVIGHSQENSRVIIEGSTTACTYSKARHRLLQVLLDAHVRTKHALDGLSGVFKGLLERRTNPGYGKMSSGLREYC